MEITNKRRSIALGKVDTATTLTQLFMMLTLERLGGHALPKCISGELRKFGIEIDGEYMQKIAKQRTSELFDVADDGQLSLKEFGAGLQSSFLVRVIRALDKQNSMTTPPRSFRFGLHKVSKCTWTPSGFTAEVKERKVRIIKGEQASDSGVSEEQLPFPQTDHESTANEAPRYRDSIPQGTVPNG